MDNSLNNKLKSLRLMIGLTQNQFADKLNITQSYLSALEGGKREVPLAIVMKLKDEFRISTEDFLYEDISNCDISTHKERSEEAKELGRKIRRYSLGEFESGRDEMIYNHNKFTERVIASNKLDDIESTILDLESTLYICHSILRDYSISQMTHEQYALFENKMITKEDLLAKYQKAVVISKKLYKVIEPFQETINNLFDQIHKFDQENDKTFYLGDDE